MQQDYRQAIAQPQGWRHLAWLGLLVAASVVSTLGIACAVPFAAFGALAALTLNRRDALLLTAVVWFANQLVGFTLLDYPWDAETFRWGVVLAGVALLSTVAAQLGVFRSGRNAITKAVIALVAAFIAYEGGLFLLSTVWLGGTEDFAPAIVVRIAEINAASFLALLLLHQVGMAIGFAGHATGAGWAQRHA